MCRAQKADQAAADTWSLPSSTADSDWRDFRCARIFKSVVINVVIGHLRKHKAWLRINGWRRTCNLLAMLPCTGVN